METTKSEHGHGGVGWEFGTCLWSPVKNARGAKSYEIMREPREGDLVLHNYHFAPPGMRLRSYLTGFSVVAGQAVVRSDEPPMPGNWRDRGDYYRVPLKGYAALGVPLDYPLFAGNYAERLRDEVTYMRGKFYPFSVFKGRVRANQGMYLSRITGLLYATIGEALGVEATDMPEVDRKSMHRSYSEGERSKRELSYFQRNPALARDAKLHFDFTCQICGFRPAQIFGAALRSTALDCHHLDPMSEREGYARESTLSDVTVLCANCHRLIHSKKPALSLEQAKKKFRVAPFTLGESLRDEEEGS